MFLLKSEELAAYILLAVTIIPIAILMIYAIVVALNKRSRISKEQKIDIEKSEDDSQKQLFYDVYGGENNIISVSKEMNRISVVVHDIEKVKVEQLKDLEQMEFY